MRILLLAVAPICATPICCANNDDTLPAPLVQPTNISLPAEVHVQMFLDHPAVMSLIGGR